MVDQAVLQKLIGSPDELSRDQVILAVTNLFLDESYQPTAVEKSRYSDIVSLVIGKLASELQVEIAERVAGTDRITRDLAVELSKGDIAVAAPVLRNSPMLTDEDLVAVTRGQSLEHRLAITDRATLSEAVTDALTEIGEQIVLQRVAANDGASFSEVGFRQLVSRGGDDAVVQSQLARRATANASFAGSLHQALGDELRAKLGPALAAISDQRLSAAMDIAALQAEEAIKDRMRQRLEMKVILKEINAQTRNVDQSILMLAQQQRLEDLGWLLSELVQLPESIGATAVNKIDPTSLGFLCKSLSVQPSTYLAVLEARCRKFGFEQVAPDKAKTDYVAIPMALAQRSVRILKLQRVVAK